MHPKMEIIKFTNDLLIMTKEPVIIKDPQYHKIKAPTFYGQIFEINIKVKNKINCKDMHSNDLFNVMYCTKKKK